MMKGSDLHKRMFTVFQSQTLSTGDKLSAIAVRIEEIENTRLPRMWDQLKQKMFYKTIGSETEKKKKAELKSWPSDTDGLWVKGKDLQKLLRSPCMLYWKQVTAKGLGSGQQFLEQLTEWRKR